jgi:hypothetical protein
LASSIPIRQLIFTNCDFFLDTIFLGFYTFVNCKVSLAGSMSTRQRENRNNGNQESSSKEASEEGSQENSKEEVSRQRNRQHNRGTPKASPDVFLAKAESSVFMRLRCTLGPAVQFLGRCGNRELRRAAFADRTDARASFPGLIFPVPPPGRRGASPRQAVKRRDENETKTNFGRGALPLTRRSKRTSLPKWYWAMTPSDETVKR